MNPSPDLCNRALCNLCDDGRRAVAVAGYLITFVGLPPDVSVIEGLGHAPVLADFAVVVRVDESK